MLQFTVGDPHDDPQSILCLGAHSDDIEIGCGGTIMRLTRMYPNVRVYWVVLSACGERQREAQNSAADFLRSAGDATVVVKHFRDGHFPYIGGAIKDYFETLKEAVAPDLIFTHCRHDLHQDHRITAELTWNTFRNHLIFEYEIPKYDGDLATPNTYIHLDATICQQKIDLLHKHFVTQTGRDWFTPETFQALLRLRGIESRAPAGYAEGFYCRKLTL